MLITFDSALTAALVFSLVPVVLYAEIHYRFKGLPSRLFMREPEIIADVPYRLEPGRRLPILLIIKDAKRFPIRLRSVTARILNAKNKVLETTLIGETHTVDAYYWWRIVALELPPAMAGCLRIDVTFEYETPHGSVKRAVNDNYRGVSHAPLETYASSQRLPLLPGFISGDVHYHSDGTDDQVEFGAPPPATGAMAEAIGLHFFSVTDHSYDIDDLSENYLRNDPQLHRWHEQRRLIAEWNAQRRGMTILPGEEVSCANRRGRNVHFLILDHSRYVPGSGDGAEHWFHTRAELSVVEILQNLELNAAAFAAHPRVKTPFLEWLLLRRGRWQREDFQHQRLDGLQFWNGHPDGMDDGLRAWREMLLEGRKLVVVAGNDAHGNFSRFRQVGFPFFKMREHRLNIFGRARTVVRGSVNDGAHQIIAALRAGHSCISTGPVLDLHIINQHGEAFGMGETARGELASISIEAASSPEIGGIQSLNILCGDVNDRREVPLLAKTDFQGETEFSIQMPIAALLPGGNLPKPGYVRAELRAKANASTLPDVRLQAQALSNPVWLDADA